MQLAWLAAAVFVLSAGYRALLPLLPGGLTSLMPDATAFDTSRHVGFLSGAYAAGVLIGAPLWGFVPDRAGRGRIQVRSRWWSPDTAESSRPAALRRRDAP